MEKISPQDVPIQLTAQDLSKAVVTLNKKTTRYLYFLSPWMKIFTPQADKKVKRRVKTP